MTTQLILNHLKDTRRRSERIWAGLSPEKYFWKSDSESFHFLEQVRHVLTADKWFHGIIIKRGNINEYSVWEDERAFTDVETELDFFKNDAEAFWNYIAGFSDEEMMSIKIFRTDKKGAEWERPLGEYLLRVAYHEATHAGRILADMRTAGMNLPYIWDDEDS